MRGALVGGAGALQHRPGRVRQAPARQARDGVGGLPRQRAPRGLRRAAGHVQPLRGRAGGQRHRARGPGGHAAAVAARDGRRVPRHLQARRDPALDVGALRRRRHPAPAARLRRQGARDRHREPPPHPRRDGGEGVRDRGSRRRRAPGLGHRPARGDGGGLRQLRDGRHRRRRPGPALLLVGHHRAGEGHPARPPLHPRPRGVRVLPRRAGRRAVPRHGRVGVGRRDRAAARARGATAPPPSSTRARAGSTPRSSCASSPSTACRACSPHPPRCAP